MSELFDPNTVTRPPIRYHGGKYRLAPWLLSHFPADHDAYVEVFGGAAGVLLRKTRSRVEVYNDLDSQVVKFFRVLRDPEQFARLCRLVDLTPFSREEFEAAYEATEDPVEAARRLLVRCHFGHGTAALDTSNSNGFKSRDMNAGKSYAREWAGIPSAICQAADRFTGVTLEHLDFRELIPKFDSEKALLYCDPPYLFATRSGRQGGGKGYVHEMSVNDHRDLAWLLNNAKAKVALSHYPSPLFDELYPATKWRRVEKSHAANGQKGAVPRTECLWMNYDAPASESSA